MRNEKLNVQFELDREARDFIGERYDEFPRLAILDMMWNTNATLFCLLNDKFGAHYGAIQIP